MCGEPAMCGVDVGEFDKVAALRDREIASAARYQRLFREFIAAWMGPSEHAALRAELMAAAVVAAHNHVLRRWLREEAIDPVGEIGHAMARVVALFPPNEEASWKPGDETTLIVIHSRHPIHDVEAAVRQVIEQM